MPSIKWGKKNSEVFKDAFIIREDVFIKEQGFTDEADDIDDYAEHMVVYDDSGVAVATGRIFPKDGEKNTYTAGRICTAKSARKTGLGKAVMEALEKRASELSGTKVFLSAQEGAKGFYEKLGYKIVGEGQYDEHCLHFPMEKEL